MYLDCEMLGEVETIDKGPKLVLIYSVSFVDTKVKILQDEMLSRSELEVAEQCTEFCIKLT